MRRVFDKRVEGSKNFLTRNERQKRPGDLHVWDMPQAKQQERLQKEVKKNDRTIFCGFIAIFRFFGQ